MLTIYFKGKQDKQARELDMFRTGAWIHVEKPTKEELAELVEKYGLDEGLLADATDPHEVPRVESEEGNTYVFTRVPSRHGGEVTTTPIVVIVCARMIVTIAQQKLDVWKAFFDHRIDFSTTQKTKLFFQIFQQVQRSYRSFLADINRTVRRTTVDLQRVSTKDIVQFVKYERTLNDFLSALYPTRNLLESILTGKFMKLYQDDDDLIEDLSLGNGQLIESCNTNLKTIVNVRSAYSTIMTHKLNQTIRFLAAVTIVLTVPTAIASFFGMNVALPFDTNSTLPFWLILIGAILVSLLWYWFYGRDRGK